MTHTYKPVNAASVVTGVVHVRPKRCSTCTAYLPAPPTAACKRGAIVPVAPSLEGLDGEVVLAVLNTAVVLQLHGCRQHGEELHRRLREVPAKVAWSHTIVEGCVCRARAAA